MSFELATEFWYRIGDTIERAELVLHAPERGPGGKDYRATFEYTFGEEHKQREAGGATEWQAFTIGLHILALMVKHGPVSRGARLYFSEEHARDEVHETNLSGIFGGLQPAAPKSSES